MVPALGAHNGGPDGASPDWSAIPQLVLCYIVQHLDDFSDVASLRLACRRWSKTVTQNAQEWRVRGPVARFHWDYLRGTLYTLCPVVDRMTVALSNRVAADVLGCMFADLNWWSRLRELVLVAVRPSGSGLFGPGLAPDALAGLSTLRGLQALTTEGCDCQLALRGALCCTQLTKLAVRSRRSPLAPTCRISNRFLELLADFQSAISQGRPHPRLPWRRHRNQLGAGAGEADGGGGGGDGPEGGAGGDDDGPDSGGPPGLQQQIQNLNPGLDLQELQDLFREDGDGGSGGGDRGAAADGDGDVVMAEAGAAEPSTLTGLGRRGRSAPAAAALASSGDAGPPYGGLRHLELDADAHFDNAASVMSLLEGHDISRSLASERLAALLAALPSLERLDLRRVPLSESLVRYSLTGLTALRELRIAIQDGRLRVERGGGGGAGAAGRAGNREAPQQPALSVLATLAEVADPGRWRPSPPMPSLSSSHRQQQQQQQQQSAQGQAQRHDGQAATAAAAGAARGSGGSSGSTSTALVPAAPVQDELSYGPPPRPGRPELHLYVSGVNSSTPAVLLSGMVPLVPRLKTLFLSHRALAPAHLLSVGQLISLECLALSLATPSSDAAGGSAASAVADGAVLRRRARLHSVAAQRELLASAMRLPPWRNRARGAAGAVASMMARASAAVGGGGGGQPYMDDVEPDSDRDSDNADVSMSDADGAGGAPGKGAPENEAYGIGLQALQRLTRLRELHLKGPQRPVGHAARVAAGLAALATNEPPRPAATLPKQPRPLDGGGGGGGGARDAQRGFSSAAAPPPHLQSHGRKPEEGDDKGPSRLQRTLACIPRASTGGAQPPRTLGRPPSASAAPRGAVQPPPPPLLQLCSSAAAAGRIPPRSIRHAVAQRSAAAETPAAAPAPAPAAAAAAAAAVAATGAVAAADEIAMDTPIGGNAATAAAVAALAAPQVSVDSILAAPSPMPGSPSNDDDDDDDLRLTTAMIPAGNADAEASCGQELGPATSHAAAAPAAPAPLSLSASAEMRSLAAALALAAAEWEGPDGEAASGGAAVGSDPFIDIPGIGLWPVDLPPPTGFEGMMEMMAEEEAEVFEPLRFALMGGRSGSGGRGRGGGGDRGGGCGAGGATGGAADGAPLHPMRRLPQYPHSPLVQQHRDLVMRHQALMLREHQQLMELTRLRNLEQGQQQQERQQGSSSQQGPGGSSGGGGATGSGGGRGRSWIRSCVGTLMGHNARGGGGGGGGGSGSGRRLVSSGEGRMYMETEETSEYSSATSGEIDAVEAAAAAMAAAAAGPADQQADGMDVDGGYAQFLGQASLGQAGGRKNDGQALGAGWGEMSLAAHGVRTPQGGSSAPRPTRALAVVPPPMMPLPASVAPPLPVPGNPVPYAAQALEDLARDRQMLRRAVLSLQRSDLAALATHGSLLEALTLHFFCMPPKVVTQLTAALPRLRRLSLRWANDQEQSPGRGACSCLVTAGRRRSCAAAATASGGRGGTLELSELPPLLESLELGGPVTLVVTAADLGGPCSSNQAPGPVWMQLRRLVLNHGIGLPDAVLPSLLARTPHLSELQLGKPRGLLPDDLASLEGLDRLRCLVMDFEGGELECPDVRRAMARGISRLAGLTALQELRWNLPDAPGAKRLRPMTVGGEDRGDHNLELCQQLSRLTGLQRLSLLSLPGCGHLLGRLEELQALRHLPFLELSA